MKPSTPLFLNSTAYFPSPQSSGFKTPPPSTRLDLTWLKTDKASSPSVYSNGPRVQLLTLISHAVARQLLKALLANLASINMLWF